MRRKDMTMWICAAAVAVALTAGCGKAESSGTEAAASQETIENRETENAAPDAQEIEIQEAEAPNTEAEEIRESEAPDGPEFPDGQAAPGNASDGQPGPEMPPDGRPAPEVPSDGLTGPDMPPGGQPGEGSTPPGDAEGTNGTSANTIENNTSLSDKTYTSSGDNENALRVDGATVTLKNVTIEKDGGTSSNTEDGDFYGQNAGFLAINGAEVTITDASITTDALNGNGVFSYGEKTVVDISNSRIRTSQNNSGGIQTTGGGTTYAQLLDVETQGNSSAAIRSDRGGGIVYVNGGSYITNGTGSPAIYCTADINVAEAFLTANASEGVVVEGKNSVTLTDCELTGNMKGTYHGDSSENLQTVMIYQSMSGDAPLGEASFTAEGGSITSKSGDLFYVTNTACAIDLKSVALTLANNIFLRIEGNSSARGWGTPGSNGGTVNLHARAQEIEGNILVDSISSLELSLESGSSFTGAINPSGGGGTVNVTLSVDSNWALTGNSHITALSGDLSNVSANGYHLYVAGEQVF